MRSSVNLTAVFKINYGYVVFDEKKVNWYIIIIYDMKPAVLFLWGCLAFTDEYLEKEMDQN